MGRITLALVEIPSAWGPRAAGHGSGGWQARATGSRRRRASGVSGLARHFPRTGRKQGNAWHRGSGLVPEVLLEIGSTPLVSDSDIVIR
jgi:hypothetical protein